MTDKSKTREQLDEKRAILRRLEEQTKQMMAEVGILEEKDRLETRIYESQKALDALNEPPEVRAKRRADQLTKEKEEAEKARKEAKSRPPSWPLPRPGRSREEANEWLSDRGM